MSVLAWLGIALLALWAVLWLGFKIVSGIVHLLVLIGVVLLVWGLVKKGARAVRDRV
jgi:cell division protein FtsX